VGKESAIAWTDHTFNAWWGCTEVSPGCDNCYARELDKARGGPTGPHWGKGVDRRVMSEAYWLQPYAWNAAAAAEGLIKRVFTLSMGDFCDPDGPDDQRERLIAVINQTPSLLWMILTKRPTYYLRYLPSKGFEHDNVTLGCTTETQEYYDVRVPFLEGAARELTRRNRERWVTRPRQRVRTFASYGPALGPITTLHREIPDMVIFEGETGGAEKRRPVDPEWARAMRDECAERGVAFFMKQLGGRTPDEAAAIVPVDLLIHQFPGVTR
jgi:protein gp37